METAALHKVDTVLQYGATGILFVVIIGVMFGTYKLLKPIAEACTKLIQEITLAIPDLRKAVKRGGTILKQISRTQTQQTKIQQEHTVLLKRLCSDKDHREELERAESG